MVKSRIVSSDMNGTFTGPTGRPGHTMSHMIAVHAGEEAFWKAKEVFDQQTSGTATMQKAFENAAPNYRGMSLLAAIKYAIEDPNEHLDDAKHIKYVAGFWEFLRILSERKMAFLVNSTGYDVTVYVVQEQAKQRLGSFNPVVDHTIGNHLLFDDVYSHLERVQPGLVTLTPEELGARQSGLRLLIESYFRDPVDSNPAFFERVSAGRIHLGLPTEDAKAELLLAHVRENYPHVKPEEIAHIGDTMGDVGGILGVARAGGKGIAFNYNKPLEDALCAAIAKEPALESRIYFVDPKGPNSNFMNVLPVLEK